MTGYLFNICGIHQANGFETGCSVMEFCNSEFVGAGWWRTTTQRWDKVFCMSTPAKRSSAKCAFTTYTFVQTTFGIWMRRINDTRVSLTSWSLAAEQRWAPPHLDISAVQLVGH